MTTTNRIPLLVLMLLPLQGMAEETDTTAEDVTSKLVIQTITTEDNFGTLEEQRVQAMRTEIRYTPSGPWSAYNLVGAEESAGSVKAAHSDADELMIPSWNLMSW
ncbi:MAG TPA: hypothetical protein PLB10_01975 [Thiolinea sp.]|nr:hypothetical protein [Thiolinea sp.]